LSKDLTAKLVEFKVTRFQVSKWIVRMNKRLVRELGSALAEQGDWHWALTNFALDVFRSSSREDLPEIAPVAADEEAES
jgi:hypothetical protein